MQGTAQFLFSRFGPKSANNFHVHFAQASPQETSSTAYGKRHVHHCEQHGAFFGQTSVMANMGANPSLLQTSPLLVLAVGCSGTVCTMPTAKTTKVFRSITKQCFPIPTVSFNVLFCGKVVSRKIIIFSENVSMLKAELTFKSHQFKVINWSNSSGIDCPRKALWCACIDAPLQNK